MCVCVCVCVCVNSGRSMADQLKKEDKERLVCACACVPRNISGWLARSRRKRRRLRVYAHTYTHTQVRMMVNKELPKLLEKLRDAVHEYETTLGLQLKVEGERIIDVLDAADESIEAAKHEAQVCTHTHTHMYVCVYVCRYTYYMKVARLPSMIHVNSMRENVNTHTCVCMCVYTQVHTSTYKQARKMEKSMKPAVPVAGGLDMSTAASTSMAAPAARDMTRKLTPRDRDPSQVHSVLMLWMCVCVCDCEGACE